MDENCHIPLKLWTEDLETVMSVKRRLLSNRDDEWLRCVTC